MNLIIHLNFCYFVLNLTRLYFKKINKSFFDQFFMSITAKMLKPWFTHFLLPPTPPSLLTLIISMLITKVKTIFIKVVHVFFNKQQVAKGLRLKIV